RARWSAPPEGGGMKILLVGDWPPPHGGVAVHVKQLHGYLAERSIDVRVLDIGVNGEGRQPGRFLSELSRHAARGYAAHLHTSGSNRKAWLVAAAVAPVGASVITVHSG